MYSPLYSNTVPFYMGPQKNNNKNIYNNVNNNPVSHTDAFKIVIILDESGSMGAIKESIINYKSD